MNKYFINVVSQFPLEDSNYCLGDFMEFLHRLEKKMKDSSPADLPFKHKQGVIETLKETTDEFKDLCLRYENKLCVLFRHNPIEFRILILNIYFFSVNVKMKIILRWRH